MTEFWNEINDYMYRCIPGMGMLALKDLFQHDACVNDMNFCLFSVSGLLGYYATLEDAKILLDNECINDDNEYELPEITFLIIQPRIRTMRYGTVEIENFDDWLFLANLRRLSAKAMKKIGY